MNVKNIRSRKALKFLGLLISAMIMATVSAQVYNYMFIDGSITPASAKMIWILGTESPGDATIAGSTVTIDLDVQLGVPANLSDVLYLKNVNGSGYFNYNISVTTALSSLDFQRAKMHIYENYTTPGNWAVLSTLDLTSPGASYADTLNASRYLEMRFEINATNAAGPYNYDIKLRYW